MDENFYQSGVSLELENQVQTIDNQQNNGSTMREINNTSVNFGSTSSSSTESSRNQQGKSSQSQKRGIGLCSFF